MTTRFQNNKRLEKRKQICFIEIKIFNYKIHFFDFVRK